MAGACARLRTLLCFRKHFQILRFSMGSCCPSIEGVVSDRYVRVVYSESEGEDLTDDRYGDKGCDVALRGSDARIFSSD